jgi:lysophospholipase L1-like esterase
VRKLLALGVLVCILASAGVVEASPTPLGKPGGIAVDSGEQDRVDSVVDDSLRQEAVIDLAGGVTGVVYEGGVGIRYGESVWTSMSGFRVPQAPFGAISTYVVADGQTDSGGHKTAGLVGSGLGFVDADAFRGSDPCPWGPESCLWDTSTYDVSSAFRSGDTGATTWVETNAGPASADCVNHVAQALTVGPRDALSRAGHVAAGVGLRNQGDGTISLDGMPLGSRVVRAFLYWMVLDDVIPSNTISLNGETLAGTLVSSDQLAPCWGDLETTHAYTFRADVTAWVTGNGDYAIADYPTGSELGLNPWDYGSPLPEAEGASIIAFYESADLRLASMGDSYSSGEGAGYIGFEIPFLYLTGTAVAGVNECHRSYTAYGQLIRQDAGIDTSDFLFSACSGATTTHILENAKWPNSPSGVPGRLKQIDDLELFNADSPADVVLLGIGGNDVGFADVLSRCFKNSALCDLYRPLVENTINAVFPRLVDTYTAIKNAAPDAEIYVFGYPQFLNRTARCVGNIGLSTDEILWIRDRVTQMNGVIKDAARASGVHYVDIENALQDDEVVCGTHAKVNGAIPQFSWPPVRVESFHPTAAAHKIFADTFVAQYPNMGNNPNPPAEYVTPPDVQGPGYEFGSMTVYDDHIVRKVGDEILITMEGFEPGSTITVGTFSEYLPYGQYKADNSGKITFTYVVPAGLGVGLHTIEAVGTNPDGDQLIGETPVMVMEPGGTFDDDDGNLHEPAIEGIAFLGITKGCNPPNNNQYCPNEPVTRGQMAAFLTRALSLTDNGQANEFADDDGSVFESAITSLAAAGITRGCNPPINDQFCPNANVTRGQMAAFLVRALGLSDDGGGNRFVDDDGSVFETDIAKLAAAGITKGCNPPTNDRFCPNDPVTRAQMATFLVRALDLQTITPPSK